MKFSVTFTDVRIPALREEEAIEVEADSNFDAIPLATEIFFTRHHEEKIGDFLVGCASR